MKLSLLTSLVFAGVLAFGQQNISELISTSKVATSKLEYIDNLDIFSYFNLTDYNTELKKSVFLKSEEGQNKLNQLKSIKEEMLKSTYYLEMKWNSPVSLDYHEHEAGSYDIEKKGFEISFRVYFDSPCENHQPPKSIALNGKQPFWIVLKALPSNRVDTHGGTSSDDILFLPMSEESGLEIENDPDNTKMYYFFTPSGREKNVMRKYYTTNTDLKADKVRIVVANSASGKIIYDNSFSYQAPPTK